MGNIVQCGDICRAPRQDHWQLPPALNNRQLHEQGGLIQHEDNQQNIVHLIRNPNQSIRKTRLGELLDQEIPAVELKVEQNHMIVPVSLVKQRITDKLSVALNQELTISNFGDDSKWYLLPSGNYYCGELKDNEPYGVGTFLLPSMIFFGSVKNKKPEGEGSILGEQFEFKGKFERGRASGEGQLIFNSCYLKGIFKNGKIQRGKLSCLQYEYEGEFLNGQPDGMGQYHSNDHQNCFIGQFERGKFLGQQLYKCHKNKYVEKDQEKQRKKGKSQAQKALKKTWLC